MVELQQISQAFLTTLLRSYRLGMVELQPGQVSGSGCSGPGYRLGMVELQLQSPQNIPHPVPCYRLGMVELQLFRFFVIQLIRIQLPLGHG